MYEKHVNFLKKISFDQELLERITALEQKVAGGGGGGAPAPAAPEAWKLDGFGWRAQKTIWYDWVAIKCLCRRYVAIDFVFDGFCLVCPKQTRQNQPIRVGCTKFHCVLLMPLSPRAHRPR